MRFAYDDERKYEDVVDATALTANLDRVASAVNLAREVVENNHGTDQRLVDAWLVLELAVERLAEVREYLEEAPSLKEYVAARKTNQSVDAELPTP